MPSPTTPGYARRSSRSLPPRSRAWQQARAGQSGIAKPQAGSVLEIQRFADGARLWPHGHLLAPDGVFYEAADGRLRFHGVGPPRDQDIRSIVARIVERVVRLLKRRAAQSPASSDGSRGAGAE
ncbi:MAG: hypothetical protein GY701_30825, partial [Sulfitobacter sp.]|nr:hypothetical protein [Sulfitobacter sp.]